MENMSYTASFVTTELVLLLTFILVSQSVVPESDTYCGISGKHWPRKRIDRDTVIRRSAASAVGFWSSEVTFVREVAADMFRFNMLCQW